MFEVSPERDELHQLERRVSAFDNREELLVDIAASNAVTHELVDMSRRIRTLEAGGPRRIE